MAEPRYRLEGIVHTRNEGLEDFEGPLDVIFLLLSKNKIEIQDVSITAILTQYLAYLDEMKRLDMEIASEFITMAAQLMFIKTRMLLSIEDEEAQSEMDALIKSLEERQRGESYLKIKQLTERLGLCQSVVSRHMKLMTEHGVVCKKTEGGRTLYYFADDCLCSICAPVVEKIRARAAEQSRLL